MFPAGLELSMQLRMTEFPILLPSPPVFWAYKCTPPHQVYAMLGTEPSFLLRPFLYQPRPRQRQPPFLPLYSLSLMMSGSPEGDRLVKAEGGVRGLHCPEGLSEEASLQSAQRPSRGRARLSVSHSLYNVLVGAVTAERTHVRTNVRPSVWHLSFLGYWQGLCRHIGVGREWAELYLL